MCTKHVVHKSHQQVGTERTYVAEIAERVNTKCILTSKGISKNDLEFFRESNSSQSRIDLFNNSVLICEAAFYDRHSSTIM